ncbi:helix-turn-helix transcriptional regulator [Nonomuraea sp. SBT364]|uniref:helix-turn-helix transcriptional regulator n=1 Tax=Nonomuraea sp. SBT364 TaxID=1580530 RepID=UPI0007C7A16F|nr:helix-turn-helix transcriptional regulator [Nonomuraea sp. SBT364]
MHHKKDGSGRGPLGDFLVARRSSLSAAEAGLPETGQARRVPGLRCEEVAVLARISTDYYRRLEQGRVRTASRTVVNSLGQALQLNGDQQRYLARLANVEVGEDNGGADLDQHIRPQVARLLTRLADTPALVTTPYLDILAWNRLAAALLGDLAAMKPQQRNYVRMVFLDPHIRSLLVDWKVRAQEAVSRFRLAIGAAPRHARIRELINELTACDGDFRTWWNQHLITTRTWGRSRLNHPIAGQFSVDWYVLANVDDNEQDVLLLSAPEGTSSHAAIRRLDAWAAEQGLAHSVDSHQ